MGEVAMNLLSASIKGSEAQAPRRVILPTTLVIRESCGVLLPRGKARD
jgi:DNA-binding LacI/PurR family transcriptional regulator